MERKSKFINKNLAFKYLVRQTEIDFQAIKHINNLHDKKCGESNAIHLTRHKILQNSLFKCPKLN